MKKRFQIPKRPLLFILNFIYSSLSTHEERGLLQKKEPLLF